METQRDKASSQKPNTPSQERSRSQSTGSQPPLEGGRMDRIADQTRGLVDDIKEWIDLKVQLVQLELEERFESLANHILATLLVIVLATTTVLFALIASALAIGNGLGDPLWGFLIVTGGLTLITVGVHLIRPNFVKAPWKGNTKQLPPAKMSDTASTVEPKKAQLPQIAKSTEKESQDG